MGAETARLFAKIGIPDCPINHSPVIDPLFADCNEAKIRTDLMDKICQAIFEARKETGNNPAWYVKNKIRFDEAMKDLKIPQEIRNKIGPSAPSFKRLLTEDGDFNQDGLHIFEKECLTNWVYVNQRGRCPQCTQPSSSSLSKAYSCFVQYQDPHRYLTDPKVQEAFLTEEQRRQKAQQSLARAQTIQYIFTKIEVGTQIYIVPLFIFVLNVSYFLRSCDILFSTDLTSKFGEKVSFLDHIQSVLNYVDTAQFLWGLYRRGEIERNAGFITLKTLYGSQFLLKERAPPLLWKSFVLYYTAQKAINLIPSRLLQNRYLQVIGKIHKTGFDYATDLALRIDSYVQHPFRRWLFPCVRYAFRTMFYLTAVYTAFLFMKSSPLKDSLEEHVEALHDILVAVINGCNTDVIYPILFQWEILKNMCLILATGEIQPMAGSYFFVYKQFVNFFTQIGRIPYLYVGLACYAVIRDLCWLLNLPNPVRYLPYVCRWENTAILNL